ncbi:MAG: gliding motility-associated transporter permease protein, partial [Planctomycetaceae bacterium]|nr:gliding motility-associated transporter permease protein [Planctomycetaceae bacterium]
MLQMLHNFGLPLLQKELLEQSARRRTYVIRIVYSTLLFFMCLATLINSLPSGTSPLAHLGFGLKMYQELTGWQFAGIYVFLPAIVCGALTIEKEQNTLGLLFLTRLGPWAIVFEKLLSRIVPMSCLLLCSLPLMAFSYSLGGIETKSLFAGVWLLSVAMFQVATITLACSAFCRTSTSALLTSYFIIAALTFALPIVDHTLLGDGVYLRITQSPVTTRFTSSTAAETIAELFL